MSNLSFCRIVFKMCLYEWKVLNISINGTHFPCLSQWFLARLLEEYESYTTHPGVGVGVHVIPWLRFCMQVLLFKNTTCIALKLSTTVPNYHTYVDYQVRSQISKWVLFDTIYLVWRTSQPCIVEFPSYWAHLFTMTHKTQACTLKLKVTLRGQRSKRVLFDTIYLVWRTSQPCIIGFPSYWAHLCTMMRWCWQK